MNRILVAALSCAVLAPVAAHAGNRIKVASAEQLARAAIKAETGQKGVYLLLLGTSKNGIRKISWSGSLNNNGRQPYGWGRASIDMKLSKSGPKGAKRVKLNPGMQ